MTPRPPRRPMLHLLEECWRMQSAHTGRELSCGLYRTDAGLEVRCGYGEENLLRSQVVPTLEAGRTLTAQWHAAVVEKGGHVDVGVATGEDMN